MFESSGGIRNTMPRHCSTLLLIIHWVRIYYIEVWHITINPYDKKVYR